MTKSKRIAMAKALEHAVNFKLANEGEKIEVLKKKNEIKTFGYTLEDLKAFNQDELKSLNDHGLIKNGDITMNALNEGKMTREEIDIQINMEKMHNARTKRAIKNIKESDRSLKSFGGMYTHAELNMLHDLHPGLESIHKEVMESEVLSQDEILEVLEQLDMYVRYVQEDNHFMV